MVKRSGTGAKRERFLTAESMQRHRKGSDPDWVPAALDWRLKPKLHGKKLERLREQILEYLYAITWGQPKGTRAELRKEIMRTSQRLYEVAVLVQAEYQGFVDYWDAKRDARRAHPGKPRDEKQDPEIPF